jgi:hypothetical protein
MKVYTCNKFTGYWPVGCAAVVWADDEQEAAEKLNLSLQNQGLMGDAKSESMLEFPGLDHVRILNDGNY